MLRRRCCRFYQCRDGRPIGSVNPTGGVAVGLASATFVLSSASLVLYVVTSGSVRLRDVSTEHIVNGRALAYDVPAENEVPTLDKADVMFSRPPYSRQEPSTVVFGVVIGMYALCCILVLIAVNLDHHEKRRREKRALVPDDSIPSSLAEHHALNEYFQGQRMQGFAQRSKNMGFQDHVRELVDEFGENFCRQHVGASFFARAIPTFSRLKRALVLIVQLHFCMLVAAVAFNVREHERPKGHYEATSCGAAQASDCTATVPLSLLSAVLAFPCIRLFVYRQLRHTCFVSQGHLSNSLYPLNTQKFAHISSKTVRESISCMRNAHERRQAHVITRRRLAHRVVHLMWRSTRPFSQDTRFYGVFASWCILFVALTFVAGVIVYVMLFTTYLKSGVVYHWLAWTLTMFFFMTLVIEPFFIASFGITWCAAVAFMAQPWGFGKHALASTTMYNDVVRQIDTQYLETMRHVGAMRIQRWWRAVLDMYRAMHEQTNAAIKIQAIHKKKINQKKYMTQRKWCMKVEVFSCQGLQETSMDDLLSPQVRLQCDVGNPNVMETKVAYQADRNAHFNETFLIDIKESKALYVSVWTIGISGEEFIGRGYFVCSELKDQQERSVSTQGVPLKLQLFDLQHGERRSPASREMGFVNLRIHFMDPLKEVSDADIGWMLPKHRMQFALSKMGGRLKVGKMLGSMSQAAGQASLSSSAALTGQVANKETTAPQEAGDVEGVASLHASTAVASGAVQAAPVVPSLNSTVPDMPLGAQAPASMPGVVQDGDEGS